MKKFLRRIKRKIKRALRKTARRIGKLKPSDWVRYAILFAAAVAFVYASYSLTDIYINYQESDETYEEIDDMFLQTVTVEETEEAEDGTLLSFTSEITTWVWDFDKLLDYNSEAMGYIKQDSSHIQYPIFQHDDNSYYLSHAADKSSSSNGAIFIDYRCEEGMEARNCVIYGHNMRSGAMFASLNNYKNEEYLEENPTFDIYVGYDHYIYYVFATYVTAATNSPVYTVDFDTDEDFTDWLETCLESATYSTFVDELSTDDKIITLSTCCGDSSKRFVVQLVRGEKVID